MGAVIGGGVGLLTGGAQIYEKRDEAFKSYVQEAVEGQYSEQKDMLASGSAIAARRETDKLSFGTMFKDQDVADQYLKDLVDMSNATPFLYDDLTAMSKTLATYGYDADGILPVLQTIGDAGAALGQSTGDMTEVATAIGQMRSSNKATRDTLDTLNNRGIGVYGMLAEAKGVDQEKIYDMISKGKITGTEAVEIILDAMTEAFPDSMEAQSKTFSGLTSIVEGLNQEMENAMGEGFNETRMAGLENQREWLDGPSGERMQEAYKAIGAWQAELENERERLEREFVDQAMSGSEYIEAEATGDAVKMGEVIMRAKIQAQNEYNASDGAKLMLESERSLIQSVRDDTALNDDYCMAGYTLGQEFSKGRAAAMSNSSELPAGITADTSLMEDLELYGEDYEEKHRNSHAFGLNYVPYDGYPITAHQGERLLTAAEARERDRGGGAQVLITGNTFQVRSDADIPAIAAALADEIEARDLAYGGA